MREVAAQHRTRPRGRPPHPDLLTPVEWTMTRWVRAGLNNVQIAQLRGCRVDTVRDHIASIVGKLELSDRAALQRWRGVPLEDEELPGIDLRTMERKLRMTSSRITAGTVTGGAPMFLVDDVARTAEWYRDHFGFEIGEYFRDDHGPHDDEPNHPALGEAIFVILNRDGHRLMLSRTMERGLGVRSNNAAKKMTGDVYFWVDGIEALFEAAKGVAGTTFIHPLLTQPYGLAEFTVQDCDGRVVTFGGEPAA
ncbi:MAG: LuxR C-terminal-related transcriptional regulator [Tepidiformaceae bacterium]